LNRRILKVYNKAGKANLRVGFLLELGFDPSFFTHYLKNGKGDVCLFVFITCSERYRTKLKPNIG